MNIRIAVLNQKGGAGKTTTAIHISEALARQNKKVLLVDADPQGSSLEWAAARQGSSVPTNDYGSLSVIGLPSIAIQSELPPLAINYDCVIIDGPPRADEIAAAAIIFSELILIPVLPSPFDVWACDAIVKLIHRGRVMKPDLKAAFVINQKISGTVIGNEVRAALDSFPIPVLHTEIGRRIAFADSATKGGTVFQTVPNESAPKEINSLVTEIKELFND